jgi:trk system potassium uptake protein TrkH
MRRPRVPVPALATLIVALLMLPPALVALWEGKAGVALAFGQSSLLLLVGAVGVSLTRTNILVRRAGRDEILTVIACFAALPLAAALPLVAAAPTLSLNRAYFEMVSTFTTTGLTSVTGLDEVDSLGAAFHVWRAMTAWFGGFTALVAAVAVFGPRNLGGYEVEIDQRAGIVGRLTGIPDWARGDTGAPVDRRLSQAVRAIAPAYLMLTALLWLLFIIAGVEPLIATVQAVGIMSTSGLTITGRTFSGGIALEALAAAFLVLAASRHAFASGGIGGRLRRFAGDPELDLAGFAVAVAAGWVLLRGIVEPVEFAMADDIVGWLRTVWGAVFTTASFLATAGYQSVAWGESHAAAGLAPPGMLLMALAAMGGGVASTAGGVKLLRSFALFRHGIGEMNQLAHPASVSARGHGRRRVGFAGAVLAWLFLMLFALALGLTALALSITGLPLDHALGAAVAASTNTGPVYAVAIGPGAPGIGELSPAARLILCVAMIIGRVEVLAVVALMNPGYWRRG